MSQRILKEFFVFWEPLELQDIINTAKPTSVQMVTRVELVLAVTLLKLTA